MLGRVLRRYVTILRREKQPFRFLVSRALMYSGLSRALVIQKSGFKLRFYPTNAAALLWADPFHVHDKQHGALEETFLHRYLRRGDVVIDVGANFGLTALAAFSVVQPSGRVYAFEPHPQVFRYLQGNIELNDAAHVITAHNLALGNRVGTVFLTDRRAADRNVVSREPTPVRVAQSTLDDVALTLPRINLLKIDVEGYEKFVLEGATRTLPRVDCVYFEANDASYATHGYTRTDVINFLAAQGFETRRLEPSGITTVVRNGDAAYGYENLIGVSDVDRLHRRLQGGP